MSSMTQEQIWTAVQEELRYQLAKPSYETWVKNTSLQSLDGNTFRIAVPSKLAKDWLEDRFASLIQETLQAVTGTEAEVDFVVAASTSRRQSRQQEQDEDDEPRLNLEEEQADLAAGLNAELNEKFKFSSFVVGNNSRFAHAAAMAVSDSPGQAYNPLFLYGGVGLGKTHLMHAIGHEVRRRFPKKRISYLTSEQFMNEVIASIQTAQMSEFRHKYRTVDVLLIDDVQFLAGKDRTKEEFFHTFNALHEINKQIVISSDQPPDFETRLAILKSKLGTAGGYVSEDVLTFIAHKVQKNIRELEGALTRVIAFASIHQREVDSEAAARLLSDIIPAASRRPISIDAIQQAVSDHYGIPLEELKGKRRDKHIVFPRQVAMYIVREETPSSLPVIGQAFGGRDHTTALHSIEKITNEMKEDERLRYEIQSIRERLYADR